ncbi:MAG TPA: DUF2878 family protein [Planctomycetota bacterium]
MRSLLQFVAFQVLWFAAVLGAARGLPWLGALALVPYLAWMLAREPGRTRLAARWITAGALGCLIDSALAGLGLLRYPAAPAAWPAWLVPPFIASLWIAFATLPHVSLAWLAPRPALAALLGALGGPLSFAAGARAGAVAPGDSTLATNVALALEYALATPLLLRWLGPPSSPRA